MAKKRFDPMGSGFNTEASKASGARRGPKGHLPSRDPRTGTILKGRRHPTFNKAIDADTRLGFKPVVSQTGAVRTTKSGPRKGEKAADPDTLKRFSTTAQRAPRSAAELRRIRSARRGNK